MSKTARKIITALSVILFVILLSSALPLIKNGRAYAEDTEAVKVAEIEDETVVYNGKDRKPDYSLHKYTVNKITDAEGNEVTAAKNVGVYTFTVSPAQGCVWESDETVDEKQFTLTITRDELKWYHPNRSSKVDGAVKEITYRHNPVQPEDHLSLVSAIGSVSFSDYSSVSGNISVTKDGETTDKAVNAGEYVFTVQDKENYVNPSFTLKINPYKIQAPVTEMNYTGSPWTIDNASLYTLQKIADKDGATVESAVNAGDYTVWVATAENFVWEDGTAGVKTFPLKINKSKLKWGYGNNLVDGDNDKFEYDAENNALSVEYDFRTNSVNELWADGARHYSASGNFNSKLIVTDEAGKVTKNAINVGEYSCTVEDDYNYVNPVLTLKIKPRKINIGDYRYMQWVPVGGELNTCRVYEYRYSLNGESKTIYVTQKLDEAPFSEWKNWVLSDEKEIKRGVVAYFEQSSRKISLKNAHTLGDKIGQAHYFTAEYKGVCEAQESGRYVAEAIITPVPNYELEYNPNDTLNTTVVPMGDGSYKVTKTWYIAYYINEFLDISSANDNVNDKVAYEFPESWTFGNYPEGGIMYPFAGHGDELNVGEFAQNKFTQPEGYTLYVYKNDRWIAISNADEWNAKEDDVMTFTLKSGETVICEDMPRSKFAYYINEFMPVGKYSIEFTIKNINFGGSEHNEWWHGMRGPSCGSEYLGVSRSFDFEVLTGVLQFDDSDLNFYGKDDAQPFRVDITTINGDYSKFFGVANANIKLTNAITKSDAEASGTYWATVADKYFDESAVLRYKLKRVANTLFYDENADVWSELLKETDTYYVYYSVNLLNYESVPTIDKYGEKFFTVELYSSLDPQKGGINAGMIFLYCALSLVACAIVVTVILLLIKRKRNGGDTEGGENGDDGEGGGGAEDEQLDLAQVLAETQPEESEKLAEVSQPEQEDEPEEELHENPDEVQQTIEEALEEPAEETVEEEKSAESESVPPAEPVEEEKPAESEPVQPTEPVEEEKPTEEEPVSPAEPVEEEKPAESESVPPAEPVEEEKPAESEPVQPAEPEPVQPHITYVAEAEIIEEHHNKLAVEEEKPVAEETAEETVEEQKPAEPAEEPVQPVEPKRPLTEEEAYEADMAYIDKIMAEAEEEYEAAHESEPSESGEDEDKK